MLDGRSSACAASASPAPGPAPGPDSWLLAQTVQLLAQLVARLQEAPGEDAQEIARGRVSVGKGSQSFRHAGSRLVRGGRRA